MSLISKVISYWKLEEANGNAIDSVGGNTLTDATATVGVAGKIGRGRQFTAASSQDLVIVNPTTLRFAAQPYTLSAWILPNTLPATGGIISKGNPANSGGEYALVCLGSVVSMQVRNGSNIAVFSANSPAGSLTAGVWTFIMGGWDGTNVFVSLNGGAAVTTAAGSIRGATNNFQLGLVGGAGFFDGVIDEVGVFTGTLTAAEQAQLYNGGAGLSYPFLPAASGGGVGIYFPLLLRR